MYKDGNFQIEHDDSLCVPLSDLTVGDHSVDDQHEYSITLLIRYGHGPMGLYDVICVHNCAKGEYEFLPAHNCKSWTVANEFG